MTVLAERHAAIKPKFEPSVLPDLTDYEEFAGRKRFTRDDFDLMFRLGVLVGRHELIDGDVIAKMGQNRLHAVIVQLLMRWLTAVYGAGYLQCQLPLEVAQTDQRSNQIEPDVAVLREEPTSYTERTPGGSDTRLVVEVSDTSLAHDLRVKTALYARAGVPEYWVIDGVGRRLFVQTEPDVENGVYPVIKVYSEEEMVSAISAPDQPVRVSELLPPVSSNAATGTGD